MASRRTLIDLLALVIMAVVAGGVPIAEMKWAERSVRRPCGYQLAPALPAADRAEVTRAAITGITVLGSTGRRGEQRQVATSELLRDGDGLRYRLWGMRGGTDIETVSAVSAVGITGRCAESAPGHVAGELSLMAVGRAQITGVRSTPGRRPDLSSMPVPQGNAPRPGETVERIRRWALTMAPTRLGWRVADIHMLEGPSDSVQTIRQTARTGTGARTPEVVLLEQMAGAIAEVFTYRFADPAATSRAAGRHLTGEAATQHRAIFDPVVARARQARSDVESEPAGLGIVHRTATSATLMVFLDREAVWYSGSKINGMRIPSARRETTLGPPGSGAVACTITAVYKNRRWRISRFQSHA